MELRGGSRSNLKVARVMAAPSATSTMMIDNTSCRRRRRKLKQYFTSSKQQTTDFSSRVMASNGSNGNTVIYKRQLFVATTIIQLLIVMNLLFASWRETGKFMVGLSEFPLKDGENLTLIISFACCGGRATQHTVIISVIAVQV